MTLETKFLAELLNQANDSTEAAKAAREGSLPDVVRAVRALETALKAALDGEPLRGLKNIGSAGVTLYAARVRAEADTKIPHFNEITTTKSFLCIDTHGELISAWWAQDLDDWELHSAPAEDSTLRVGDIEDVAKTFVAILPRHVKSARKTAGRYLAAQKLAVCVRDALASDPERL